MGLGCEWRHASEQWMENFGNFWKKQLIEIWTWVRAVQIGSTGCAARFLGQSVEIGLWAGQFSWGVDSGRCRNSHFYTCLYFDYATVLLSPSTSRLFPRFLFRKNQCFRNADPLIPFLYLMTCQPLCVILYKSWFSWKPTVLLFKPLMRE